MNSRLLRPLIPALCLALIAPAALSARTKLVTLPSRATLVVNLENPAHSLLYEERDIALQQGTNHVDFSWQGVSIDRNSILLELLDRPHDDPAATQIINVAYPPGEEALTWELYAPEARTERIRVSYLLRGISRSFFYEMTVNPGETEAFFQQYFQMSNVSGEDLDDAAIRILQADDWLRSIQAGETRRFLASEQDAVPIRKLYVARPNPNVQRRPGSDDTETIGLVYEFENNAAAGLGKAKLEPGKTRIFGEASDGGTIFFGEDLLSAVPVGEEAGLRLGSVRDVTLRRFVESDTRENERTNTSGRVVAYDRVVRLRYDIQNFKDEAAVLRIVESLPADARVVALNEDGLEAERRSAREQVLDIELEPRPETGEPPTRSVHLTYRIDHVLN